MNLGKHHVDPLRNYQPLSFTHSLRWVSDLIHNLEQIRVVKRTLINHKSCINNLQPKYPQRSSDSTIGLDYFSKISKRF